MSSYSTIRGIARGKFIELEQDCGLPDGQSVVVLVLPIDHSNTLGEGLISSFGGWADDAEGLDEYLEWNRQQRKISRPAIED